MPMPELVPIFDDGEPAATTAEPDLTLVDGEGDAEASRPLSDREQVELYLNTFAMIFNNGRRWLDP